mgnify:CR=1 FL=1
MVLHCREIDKPKKYRDSRNWTFTIGGNAVSRIIEWIDCARSGASDDAVEGSLDPGQWVEESHRHKIFKQIECLRPACPSGRS